jgi:hypothetical protein
MSHHADHLVGPNVYRSRPNTTRLEAMLSLAGAPGARFSLRRTTSRSELLPKIGSARSIELKITAATPAIYRPADFGNRILHANRLITANVVKKQMTNPTHFITMAL